MSGFRFKNMLGASLSAGEVSVAAAMLSKAYTKWQNDPRNTAPMKTDTSPEVYERMLKSVEREVVLYLEDDVIRGVFVHSFSPQYDQYSLRKLSYLAVNPAERGFGPLREIFERYAAFVATQGEDVIVTSDQDQGTLNSLLDAAGFREAEDRNETYYLLSQLMFRKVFNSMRVAGDFVVDEIIVADGKAIRRNKKLLRLKASPFDSWELYRRQQEKRVARSVPPQNLALLREAFSHADLGVFFVSDFIGAIVRINEAKGGFDLRSRLAGADPALLAEAVDHSRGTLALLADSPQAVERLARKAVLRSGFFDFLTYSSRILGSFFVTSGALPQLVRGVLERRLHPNLQLRYADLIESILCPEAEPLPETRTLSDGSKRTPWRMSGPFVRFEPGRYLPDKAAMAERIMALKADSPTPLVYLSHDVYPDLLARLYAKAQEGPYPVLVLDLGNDLPVYAQKELYQGRPEDNPRFSVVSVRDFYQVPVMLEAMGVRTERGIDLERA